jgi:hypothetical protein
MKWTRELIEMYILNYHALKEYEVTPWEVVDVIGGELAVRGEKTFRAPFETQALMNAEFDRAVKGLGELGELTFRLYYLNQFSHVERKRALRNVKKQLINILLESEKPPKKSGAGITRELLGGK